jgi:sugar phosphate isomerase/epimerase
MQPTRRELLGAGIAAVIGTAVRPRTSPAAVVPQTSKFAPGKIQPLIKLSCCAYSYRKYLPRDGKKSEISLYDWLDLAASWPLDGVELTSYYFDSEDTPYLNSLKTRAFKLGLGISGTAVGNRFCLPPGKERDDQIAMVKRWIDHSVQLGAPVMRVFAGGPSGNVSRETAFGWVADCLKTCCDYAAPRGVLLALEDHGYLTETADDILQLVDAVNHESLGVNLDTGNFRQKNPYDAIAKVAPKALTAHIKVQLLSPDGKGRENADYARIIRILRGANYRGYISLEYEDEEEPKTGVPKQLARVREAIDAAK